MNSVVVLQTLQPHAVPVHGDGTSLQSQRLHKQDDCSIFCLCARACLFSALAFVGLGYWVINPLSPSSPLTFLFKKNPKCWHCRWRVYCFRKQERVQQVWHCQTRRVGSDCSSYLEVVVELKRTVQRRRLALSNARMCTSKNNAAPNGPRSPPLLICLTCMYLWACVRVCGY